MPSKKPAGLFYFSDKLNNNQDHQPNLNHDRIRHMTSTLPRAQIPPRDTGWTVVRENLAALIGFALMLASVIMVILVISGTVPFIATAAVLITTLVYTSVLRA